jgi:hypothetical protein
MRHAPRHEVARVVVHEADDVDHLIAAQLELKDVALPQLVWFGAFEAPYRMVTCVRACVPLRYQPRLAQDAVRRARRNPQALKPSQHVADAPRPPVWVRFLQRQHCVPFVLLLLAVPSSVDLRRRRHLT